MQENQDGGIVQVFRNNEKERLRIVEMRQCDAEKAGVNRGTGWRMNKLKKFVLDNGQRLLYGISKNNIL